MVSRYELSSKHGTFSRPVPVLSDSGKPVRWLKSCCHLVQAAEHERLKAERQAMTLSLAANQERIR